MSFSDMDNTTQNPPGLFDGVKFWARLFGEILGILVASVILYFIARPTVAFLFGSAGESFTFTWFVVTFIAAWWYRRRRARVGY
jgi:hypothetical protein